MIGVCAVRCELCVCLCVQIAVRMCAQFRFFERTSSFDEKYDHVRLYVRVITGVTKVCQSVTTGTDTR